MDGCLPTGGYRGCCEIEGDTGCYHASQTETEIFANDLQAASPDVHLALTRAGVTGVHKVIRIAHAGSELVYYADIDAYVDLDPKQKGVHMSRFPETVSEAIDQVVIGESLHVEDLAERIASQIVERQQALRSEVMIRAKFPVTRRTPVTDLPTQEIYTLIGHALANTGPHAADGGRRGARAERVPVRAGPGARAGGGAAARGRATTSAQIARDLRAAAGGDAQPAGRGHADAGHQPRGGRA